MDPVQREDNVALAAQISSNSQLENELRLTLGEMARLQNQLAESNTKILTMQGKPTKVITSDQAEVIASISQELRQRVAVEEGHFQ